MGWSSIIAHQGSATCYQIVAIKNSNGFRKGKGGKHSTQQFAQSVEIDKEDKSFVEVMRSSCAQIWKGTLERADSKEQLNTVVE